MVIVAFVVIFDVNKLVYDIISLWLLGFKLALDMSVVHIISLIRMRSKRDIKMGRLCTPGGAVLGIVGGGVRFRFLNGEAIFEEYMLFWVRLYALVVVLKILLDFSL